MMSQAAFAIYPSYCWLSPWKRLLFIAAAVIATKNGLTCIDFLFVFRATNYITVWILLVE